MLQIGGPVFGTADYVVVIAVLLVSSMIGVYYRFTGGKQKTVQEYLLADRNMSIIPVAFSLMASFMSAITLLGVSSENYTYGFQFIVINVSYLICTPIAAYLYLPVFFKLQTTSAYEYLEMRFGAISRLAASISYSLQMILYMGVVIYAPALALEALTGISKTTAILSIGLVCTFYSTIGGMKAVLMTDVFQSLLMFGAVLSVIGYALKEHGSFSKIWLIADRGNRTNLLNFNPDPTERHSWFSLIIGGGVTYLSLYAVNQTQIQRYLTIRDLRGAQKALWLNLLLFSALSLCTSFAGLAIYSKYRDCDPVTAGFIKRSDQLMPYYVIDTMGTIPGLSGLFVAGIFSASLSTISAALNSLAAVTIEDYYKPIHRILFKRDFKASNASLHTKFIVLTYGFVFLGVAFLAQLLGGLLQAGLTIFGVIGGPLLGFFSLGMFTFVANQFGAVVGLISGIALALCMAFGPKPPPMRLPVSVEGCEGTLFVITANITSKFSKEEYFWLYRVSYLYNCVFGLLTTVLVGYLVSYIHRKLTRNAIEEEMYDPRLFIPPLCRKLEKSRRTKIKGDGIRRASLETLK